MGRLTSSPPPISIVFLAFLVLANGGNALGGSSTERSGARRLFIFGDSTVDVGNNNYIDSIPSHRARHPPYGLNGFFGGPTGRFSDGRLVVDFIADYAGLPFIPPFLQPSAKLDNGANFASGGATILPETGKGWGLALGTQLNLFKKMQRSLAREFGDAKTKEQLSEAVYFISIGSNDYIVDYISDLELQKMYPPEEYIGMVIGNLTQAIQELYETGARKFSFLSLGPLGCAPAVRVLGPNGTHGRCFEEVSELAVAHNNMLSASLVGLEYLLEGFKYVNPNAYEWIGDRIYHPLKYGFIDGENACCGRGPYGGIYSCGDTKEGMKEYELCGSPEEHVWWDSYHLSEKVNEQLAKKLWKNTALKGFFTKDSVITDDPTNLQDEL
ncbi:GDSL esterase/lipase 5-like [Iris pallida]|uniref:GDSL esterase/lipase 5-like n=1 Tax=Iris pallida TaxID=29817 RepID=A0AAX6FQM9_IRIPA|nr:GDSL esterase/lipase 5-like [Iris pallida]